MFDIRPLLAFSFWFNANPPPLLPFFENAFFVLYIAFLIIAVALGVLLRREKHAIRLQLLQRFRRLATTGGMFGLLLAFFSYERTPALSMRFFTVLLWGWMAVWGAMIFYWRMRVAPSIVKSIAEKKTFEKYLPK